MLTAQERTLVHRLWSTGPSVLFDLGYTTEKAREFLERPEVVAELTYLDREFKHAASFDVRTRYATRRRFSQLAPGASALVANAMAGPEYMRGPNQEILRDARGLPILRQPEVTGMQLRAAEIVLNVLGVSDKAAAEVRDDVPLEALVTHEVEQTVVIETDPTHTSTEQRALSRERVRNTIERLMLRLPDVRARVNKLIELPAAAVPIEAPPAAAAAPKVFRRKPSRTARDGSKG